MNLGVITRIVFMIKGVKIHPLALINSRQVGSGTRIWAFVNIMDNVKIGENCNICDRCFIESGVEIGNNVTIKTGVSIWTGVRIDDNVFIGPGVQFCNDKYPRSGYHIKPLKTTIHKNASIGANATLLPGLTIGEGSMVGAGSVVTKDVKENSVVIGNPAKEISICQDFR